MSCPDGCACTACLAEPLRCPDCGAGVDLRCVADRYLCTERCGWEATEPPRTPLRSRAIAEAMLRARRRAAH